MQNSWKHKAGSITAGRNTTPQSTIPSSIYTTTTAAIMVLPSEPEFEQALSEVTTSLEHFLVANPEYRKALEIVQVPERIIQFRVVWEDDQNRAQVNRGYRVQVRV